MNRHAGLIATALIHRYLGGLLDPFVTLLEVHKLMYFMQVAGEPLRLKYVKHHYGPYAENLRHVLKAVEGHLIAGYADGGDAPDAGDDSGEHAAILVSAWKAGRRGGWRPGDGLRRSAV